MTELKTQRNNGNVVDFLESIDNRARREDGLELLRLYEQWTGQKAVMWGESIVGFGSYHYKYASGKEGDWPVAGFSPRKQSLTIYIMNGFDSYGSLLKKLGKHKTSVSCLYVSRLADIDMTVLEDIVKDSYRATEKMNV
jgi:hypothetical protein